MYRPSQTPHPTLSSARIASQNKFPTERKKLKATERTKTPGRDRNPREESVTMLASSDDEADNGISIFEICCDKNKLDDACADSHNGRRRTEIEDSSKQTGLRRSRSEKLSF